MEKAQVMRIRRRKGKAIWPRCLAAFLRCFFIGRWIEMGRDSVLCSACHGPLGCPWSVPGSRRPRWRWLCGVRDWSDTQPNIWVFWTFEGWYYQGCVGMTSAVPNRYVLFIPLPECRTSCKAIGPRRNDGQDASMAGEESG
jgi:hypothetical protein